MERFYCEDRANGERQVYDTLSDALKDAQTTLKDYRKEATLDGEWDRSVEDLTVGIVAESGDEEDDIVTHRTRYIPDEDDQDAFDVVILPVDQVVPA